MNRREAALVLGAPTLSALSACQHPTRMTNPAAEFAHVPWSHDTSIYEVNVRQYTPEGTLAAFERELPRLAQMGVGIVWLMPVQPIGVKERKCALGSYYAIRDYTAVNPEFGTLDDFRRVVDKAHALGMKLILDWVANHTAWDHAWATSHPAYYKKNAQGQIFPVTFTNGPEPEYWTDVIGLDYTHRPLWDAMLGEMAFWLKETGIDGFRCDVAGLVPTPFWEFAREALDRIKPVFMLAEWSEPELHRKAFDMTYDWALYDVLKKVAQGQGDARDLQACVETPKQRFPRDAYRMTFTGNHDSNSWHGCDAELYGSRDAFQAMAVLTATLPGMPLIYGGQEAFFEKRLKFFEKDPIDWKDRGLAGFYRELLALKRHHSSLWNGQHGEAAKVIDTGNRAVFRFTRGDGPERVTVSVNLTNRRQAMPGVGGADLEPWGWRVG